MTFDFKKFRKIEKEKLRIMLALDVDAFIDFIKEHNDGVGPSCRETAIVALHKARLISSEVPEDKKKKSRKWLKNNGYGG